MAPNSVPLLNTSTLPVAGSSMPYSPLIGASSESTTMRDGVGVDLLVGAGDRRAVGVERVLAGGDDPRRERGEHDEREQDRVRRRQREAGLAVRSRRRARSPRLGSSPVGLGAQSTATPCDLTPSAHVDRRDAWRPRRIGDPPADAGVVAGPGEQGDDGERTTTPRSPSGAWSSASRPGLLHRVPQERAGHAVAAAAALAELEAGDLDHLDAGLAHLGDRVGVALVGDDDAGLEGDDVVAVVPLLALLLVLRRRRSRRRAASRPRGRRPPRRGSRPRR